MNIVDLTLAYLRESLSNHVDNHHVCRRIYEKLESNDYKSQIEFARDLDENEIEILRNVLNHELEYARNEQDEKREAQLQSVNALFM